MLDHKTGTDSHDISVKLTKLGINMIAPIRTQIFNNYLSNGVFISTVKIAKVSLINKGGKKDVLPNY